MCSYKLLSFVSIELVIFLFTYLGIGLAVLALWYELMCYGTKWVYNYDWKTYYYTAKEDNNENSKFFYCTRCDPNGPEKPYGSNVLSNIRTHLRTAE